MNNRKYILEDEFPKHKEKLDKIKDEIRAQGKAKSIAFSQWETFHDNPAGEQVEMEQRMSSWMYRDIRSLIKESQKLTFEALKSNPDDIVAIWKLVTIVIDDDWEEEERTFMIWGHQTPIEWRVSYDAPLVKAIIWKSKGDEIETFIWGKMKIIEVIWISRWENIITH